MRRITTIIALLVALAAVGCGVGPDKSREDANDVTGVCPEGTARSAEPDCVDKTSPTVIAFNNHYPNIETKCDGFGHRIYVATHDSATGRNIMVVPDPSCPGYRKDEPPVTVSSG